MNNTFDDFVANEHFDTLMVSSDGDAWIGKGIGSKGRVKGEVCFNTSMTGYQEIMTDPSYFGQIICFTFPHVGNVGCNRDDFESQKVFCKGVVLREHPTADSNFRSECSLQSWMKELGVIGLTGVDTRALTRNIREKGVRNVMLHFAEKGETLSSESLMRELEDYPTLLGQDLTLAISTQDSYRWDEGFVDVGRKAKKINPEGKYNVVVLDYGIKYNILRCLVENDLAVTVVPGYSSCEEIYEHRPDGIFLSNGPGDPFATSDYAVNVIKDLMAKNIPIFGICLGNQLLSLAGGLKTIKMERGHRGGNHPVKNLKTGRVEITSQNHGFCVSHENVPSNIEVTHISLFDGTIEGISFKDRAAFSVQYHPESSPGPHDSRYLFEQFYEMIRKFKNGGDLA